MVESKKIRVSRDEALAIEFALSEQNLLGKVVLMETKMAEPKIDEFMIRISSIAPLSLDEAVRLKNELLEKAGHLLGEGSDYKKIFIRPLGEKMGKRAQFNNPSL